MANPQCPNPGTHGRQRFSRRRLLAVVAGFVVASSVVAAVSFSWMGRGGKFSVVDRGGGNASALEDRDLTLLKSAAAYLNETFEIPRDIPIVIDAEAPGPQWEGDTGRIAIPPAWLAEVRAQSLPENMGLPDLSADEMQSGVILFTLFHEVAHALIATLNLPTLSWEEDMADTLGGTFVPVILKEARADSINELDISKIPLAMAHYFLDKVKAQTVEKMWGLYSVNMQRGTTVTCLVYGNDPVQFKTLADAIPDTAEAPCREYAKRFVAGWGQLLGPYFKNRQRQAEVDIPRGNGSVEVVKEAGIEDSQQVQDSVQAANRARDRLNKLFIFPENTPIAVVKADDTLPTYTVDKQQVVLPMWVPDRKQIVLPIGFIAAVEGLANKMAPNGEKSAKRESAMGVVEFFLMREAGKMLLDVYRLPAVGWVPDMIDIFATFTFSTGGPFVSSNLDAGQAVVDVAEIFKYLAKDAPGSSDYWQVWSVPAQRNAAILCMLYGINQSGFPIPPETIPAEEREVCVGEANVYGSGWERVLANYRR